MRSKVILCMKWGSLYCADYVNVLFSACKKYISGEFRFVCLTDDSAGLSADIESFPIPEIGLSEIHFKNGAWPKITVFSDDLYGITGRALFIDLDTYINRSIDEMFEFPGDLVAIDSSPWRYSDGIRRTMSSIFSFELGTLGYVTRILSSDIEGNFSKYGIEQDYLHAVVKNISYWPDEWIVSFKYHLRQPLVFDRFRPPNSPPQKAKIVAFHGRPRPSDLLGGYRGNWDVFPHYGSGAVDWMRDYWVEHGGALPVAVK